MFFCGPIFGQVHTSGTDRSTDHFEGCETNAEIDAGQKQIMVEFLCVGLGTSGQKAYQLVEIERSIQRYPSQAKDQTAMHTRLHRRDRKPNTSFSTISVFTGCIRWFAIAVERD